MKNLKVTIASPNHQDVILNILKETQAWLWEKGINQWTLPFEAEWIAESIESQEFFVVTVQEETAAVFRLTGHDTLWDDQSDKAIYLHSLAVHENWRGNAIGKHILNWIETYGGELNKQFMRLDCMAENLILCRYYEQAGFKQVDIKKIENDDSTYKAKLYEKVLTGG